MRTWSLIWGPEPNAERPAKGTFDWLDDFLAKNPKFVEHHGWYKILEALEACGGDGESWGWRASVLGCQGVRI